MRKTRVRASSLAIVLVALAFAGQLAAQDRNVVYDSTLFNAMKYRMVGPYRGGRSTAVTGVLHRPFTFLMGMTGGGVWTTTDAGNRWTNISDGYFGGSIGAVAVAPSDHNVIYVGQGSIDIRGNTSIGRGVYKTVDGGKTWSFIGLREAGQIGRIRVHPADADLVYVAALGHAFGKNRERGVFRSRDGGATWEHVLALNDSTGASDLAMNLQNPREIYAGMWRGERKPWAVISGAAEGGVYKTSDGGDSWKKLEGGLPQGLVGKVGVTVSPANPDRVWAIIQSEPDGGVYRSDDAGETWERTNKENKLRQRAFYYTHIVADPQDENTVYGLNTQLFRSIDGGKTFENVDVPHGDVHDLWIDPDDPKIMIVANDGGGQVTLNGGKTWSTYMNQPTAELYDVIVDNDFPYRLYAGQQDNTAISIPAWFSSNTLHPKEHWENIGGCETGPVGLHPDHTEVIYGGCYSGIIDRWDRTTGQRRWVSIYPQEQSGEAAYNLKYRFQWVAPIVVSPHDPNVVYHGSQFVHRTTDGGMTWETISPDLTTDTREHQDYAGGPIDHDITGVEVFNTIFAISISPHSPDVIWVGSDDGRVHLSRDNGSSWKDITPKDMPEYGTVDEIEL
ncbi:MAG: glycosyl hydrolase, partial [Gemmatimonadota bacterium]